MAKCTPHDGRRVRRHVAIIYRASVAWGKPPPIVDIGLISPKNLPVCPARRSVSPFLPFLTNSTEWLMELHGISRSVGTLWIIPLTRRSSSNDGHRILMRDIASRVRIRRAEGFRQGLNLTRGTTRRNRR